MAGSGSIKDSYRHIILSNIQNFCNKISCIQGNCFTRFKKDFQTVLLLQVLYAFFKTGDIVVLTGYVVTAAEINPFHISEYITEFFLNCFKSSFKVIGILFAESVEMQTAYASEIVLTEVCECDPET